MVLAQSSVQMKPESSNPLTTNDLYAAWAEMALYKRLGRDEKKNAV